MWTLYAGAGLALTAGLLLGATLKPRLVTDGAPSGPQASAGWTRASTSGAPDEAARVASYGGHLPAYVMGTDWQTAPQTLAATPTAEAPPPEPAVDYYDRPLIDDLPAPAARVEVSERSAGDDRDERVSFPSLEGGTADDAAARAQAPPPLDAGDKPDEAPPEAAGGVALAR